MHMRLARVAMAGCALVLASAITTSASAFSTGSGVPWDAPLTTTTSWMTGPLVRYALLAISVLLGLAFAFAEEHMNKWLGRGTRLVVGLTFAATCGVWFAAQVGIGSGALLP